MTGSASSTFQRKWGLLLGLAVVVVVAGVALWKFVPRAEEVRSRGFGNYVFSDPGRIYRGRAALARRPAVVDSSRVYVKIPEYIPIRRQGISNKKPQYHLMMQKASKRFSRAVSAAAKAAGHDVVAEVGTVEVAGPDVAAPPDLTDDVIRQLR
jgi:hypothetical protein